MFKIIIFLVIYTIAHGHTWSELSMIYPRAQFVVVGESTTIDKFPYQISLQYLDRHVCGGSIISDLWIITARRCVYGDVENFTVRAGSTFHDQGGALYSVAEIIRYESNDELPHDDIALIRLVKPLYLDERCQPITLFKAGEVSSPGAIATISGWDNNTNGINVELQMTTAPIISKAQCNESYADCGGIPEKQICAGWPESDKNVCNKGSGSPLVIDKRLAGIVSWCGPDCKAIGYPSVYTEISEYRQWIREKSEL